MNCDAISVWRIGIDHHWSLRRISEHFRATSFVVRFRRSDNLLSWRVADLHERRRIHRQFNERHRRGSVDSSGRFHRMHRRFLVLRFVRRRVFLFRS